MIGRTYDFSYWNELPKVSCQCITYGRIDLLEEAVNCFLMQDYPGEKELVILNDAANYTLSFSHPEIRIYNKKERYETIGGKRNACVSLCEGDVILPWDDDDISLPWRISTIIQEMKNLRYFKASSYWFISAGKLRPEPHKQVAHGMGGWTRELFDEIGGYPEIQSGQDTGFENKIRQLDGVRDVHELLYEELYYIYRWGTGHYHLSGFGTGQKGYDIIGRRIENAEGGEIELMPHFNNDYLQMIEDLVYGTGQESL